MFLNIKLKLRDEYGYTFTDIENVDLEIKDIGNFHVSFENLFNGQKLLEDTTNTVFNENWRDFYEVLKPAITEAVEVLLTDRLARGYSYVPATYFIENIPSAADHKIDA